MKTKNFLSGSSTSYSPMVLIGIKAEDKLLVESGKIISLDEQKGKCECRKIPCQDCADALLMNQFEKIDFDLLKRILTKNEYYVIVHFFGVNCSIEKSAGEISEDLDMTLDHVLSIKGQALEKLRKKNKKIFLN